MIDVEADVVTAAAREPKTLGEILGKLGEAQKAIPVLQKKQTEAAHAADDGAMRRNHWLGKTMLELARVPGTGKAWWPLLPADYMQATYQRMPRLNPINLDAIIRIFWQIIEPKMGEMDEGWLRDSWRALSRPNHAMVLVDASKLGSLLDTVTLHYRGMGHKGEHDPLSHDQPSGLWLDGNVPFVRTFDNGCKVGLLYPENKDTDRKAHAWMFDRWREATQLAEQLVAQPDMPLPKGRVKLPKPLTMEAQFASPLS